MSSSNYLVRKAEEVMLRREMMAREYDVNSERNQGIKPDEPARKMVPAAAFANLVITRPDLPSFVKIQTFPSGHKVSDKPADLENPNPFQQAQAKDGAANVVQSTALQFNDVNGAGVLFASNGAPESLPDKWAKCACCSSKTGGIAPRWYELAEPAFRSGYTSAPCGWSAALKVG